MKEGKQHSKVSKSESTNFIFVRAPCRPRTDSEVKKRYYMLEASWLTPVSPATETRKWICGSRRSLSRSRDLTSREPSVTKPRYQGTSAGTLTACLRRQHDVVWPFVPSIDRYNEM